MELTLTDAVFRGAAHVEARVTAAVLGLVHLGAARSAAEGRVIHHAPLGRCCQKEERHVSATDNANAFRHIRIISGMRESVPTGLGLVLTVGAAPALRAGAFVLVQAVHAGAAVLAGIARTLADVCRQRARMIMNEI